MPERNVTVLIGFWKAGEYISAKLSNITQQTYFNKANIVLLNCQNIHNESDLYKNFLKYDNVFDIHYEEHINLYATWNDGIKMTKSEFIMNSNVDDMLHPEYIEKCSRWLEENKQYACVSTGILLTYIPNQIYPNWKWDDKFPTYPYPMSTAGPCPMWRRSLHDKYGYFDDRCASIGDAIMWEKWLNGGEKFGLINDDMVLYYANNDSLERRMIDGISIRTHDLKRIGRI